MPWSGAGCGWPTKQATKIHFSRGWQLLVGKETTGDTHKKKMRWEGDRVCKPINSEKDQSSRDGLLYITSISLRPGG